MILKKKAVVSAIVILNFEYLPSLALDKVSVNLVNFVRADPMHKFRANMKATNATIGQLAHQGHQGRWLALRGADE